MMSRQTRFPAMSSGIAQALAAAGTPVMLDGMEVLFDRTVGLYPVSLEAAENAPVRGDQDDQSARGNGAGG